MTAPLSLSGRAEAVARGGDEKPTRPGTGTPNGEVVAA